MKNLAELDEKLAPIKKKQWKGRDLPFPVLLDSTGQTVKEWGIRFWPTSILINPEGVLVGQSSLSHLKDHLNKEAKAVGKSSDQEREK